MATTEVGRNARAERKRITDERKRKRTTVQQEDRWMEDILKSHATSSSNSNNVVRRRRQREKKNSPRYAGNSPTRSLFDRVGTGKDKRPVTASARHKLATERQKRKDSKQIVVAEKSDKEVHGTRVEDEEDSHDSMNESASSSQGTDRESSDSEEEDVPIKSVITTTAKASALETSSSKASASKGKSSSDVNESLLKSFNTHVAFGIWNKHEERGPLKCISHYRKLQEWNLDDMPNEVVEKVKNSGLYNLVQHTYKHVDYVTISAFIERWYPETNSFHMPFGEMTITLDDVAQILKIPVVGACLYKEKDDRNVSDLLKEYLELDDIEIKEETNDSSSIKLHFLLDKFSGRALKEGANEHDFEVAARAYLLYLLGCSIFCDKSGTKVSVNYLRCLDDINHLSEQAWGMGVLAYLYRQLGLASRRDVRQMAGYLTLLTAWIYDHFPMLPNAVPNKDYENSMPRMCRWQPVKQSGDPTSAIIRLREQLDDLTAQDVCWDPYRDVRSDYPLPDVAFYNGVVLCFDIAEPYYPMRVLRQFGICQRIPTSPMEPKKSRRGLNANQYKVEYDNSLWYARNWQDHVLAQNSRTPAVVDPWNCTAKYLPWFLSVSHPTVQHPDLRQSGSRRVDDVEKFRMAAGKVIDLLKSNLNEPPPRKSSVLLQRDREAVDILEDVLNEPDRREKRKKRSNDPAV